MAAQYLTISAASILATDNKSPINKLPIKRYICAFQLGMKLQVNIVLKVALYNSNSFERIIGSVSSYIALANGLDQKFEHFKEYDQYSLNIFVFKL
jgi:hypothetical protein